MSRNCFTYFTSFKESFKASGEIWLKKGIIIDVNKRAKQKLSSKPPKKRKKTEKIPVANEKRIPAVLFSKKRPNRGTIKTAPKATEPDRSSNIEAVKGFIVVRLKISERIKKVTKVVAVI